MKELKDLKLKDAKKILAMSEADLRKEITNESKKLYVLKIKVSLGEFKQTHLVKFLRRHVAMLYTVANQKGFNIS